MAADFFDDMYRKGPPWEVGHPQSAFVELMSNNELVVGKALDIGCGTGENAILLAQNGFSVVGIDIIPSAIEKAKQKARKLGVAIDFSVGDALHLRFPADEFDSVIDSGVFHIFDDKSRRVYIDQIAKVLRPDGGYFMLCFSEKEPTDWGGPRRVSKEEIEEALAPNFEVNFIHETILESNIHESGGGLAYISSARRK